MHVKKAIKVSALAVLSILLVGSACLGMEALRPTDEKRQQTILRLFQSANQKKDITTVKRLLDTIPYEELQSIWQELLFMGYDSLNRDFLKELAIYTLSKESALHGAAREGSLEKINQLVNNENINNKNLDGRTPLYLTTLNKNLEASILLLKTGASPCSQDLLGMTPFHEGVSVAADNPDDPNSFLLLKLFFEHGAKACLNKKQRDGTSPLHTAIRSQTPAVALFLLEMGANPTSKDNYGDTPLHDVSLRYKGTPEQAVEIAQKLIAKGADINAQNNEGDTALFLAALKLENKKPNTDLLYFLLTHNADTRIKDNWNTSARDVFEQTWSITPETFLFRHKQPVEAQLREKSFEVVPIKKPKTKEVKSKKAKKHKVKLTFAQQQAKKALLAEQAPKIEEPAVTQSSKENVQKVCAVAPATAKPKLPTLQFAARVKDWWNDNWLVRRKQTAKAEGAYEYWKFLSSRLYHRLPEKALQTIVAYGDPAPRPNKTYKGQIDTQYTLEGEMQFENIANPWNPGKQRQPGFYHVTKDINNQIYHIGFKPIQNRGMQLSDFIPELQIPVEWVNKETPSYIAVYDPKEGVRHLLYLKK